MKLKINEQNDTATLECSVKDMQKVLCAIMYIRGSTFSELFDQTVSGPLHPDICIEALKQVIDYADVSADGNIEVLCAFEVVE